MTHAIKTILTLGLCAAIALVSLLGSAEDPHDAIDHAEYAMERARLSYANQTIRRQTPELDDDELWEGLLRCIHSDIAIFERTLETDEVFDVRWYEGEDFEATIVRTIIWRMKRKWAIFPRRKGRSALDNLTNMVVEELEKALHSVLDMTHIKNGFFHSRVRLALYADKDGVMHVSAFLAEDSSPLVFMNRSCPEDKITPFVKELGLW